MSGEGPIADAIRKRQLEIEQLKEAMSGRVPPAEEEYLGADNAATDDEVGIDFRSFIDPAGNIRLHTGGVEIDLPGEPSYEDPNAAAPAWDSPAHRDWVRSWDRGAGQEEGPPPEPVEVKCSCGCGAKRDVATIIPTRVFEHENAPGPILEFRFGCGTPAGIELRDLDDRPDLQHRLLDEAIFIEDLREEYVGKGKR